jgi:hypothetical protein
MINGFDQRFTHNDFKWITNISLHFKGQYPHPTDQTCTSYIICSDEVMDIMQCPDPLVYDPISETCAAIEVVGECRLSCVGKVDGR